MVTKKLYEKKSIFGYGGGEDTSKRSGFMWGLGGRDAILSKNPKSLRKKIVSTGREVYMLQHLPEGRKRVNRIKDTRSR